ncbi:DUF6265 family protein [Halocola ammonii]
MNSTLKMKVSQLALFAFVLAAAGCDEPMNKSFEVDQIVGKWRDSSKKNAYYEQWSKSDSIYIGNGFVMADKDTVFIENLRIQEEDGLLHYYAQVHNQNEGSAVPFTEEEKSETKITFSNHQHEFPQHITYEIVDDSTLNVVVDGEEYGKYRKLEFDFKKIE